MSYGILGSAKGRHKQTLYRVMDTAASNVRLTTCARRQLSHARPGRQRCAVHEASASTRVCKNFTRDLSEALN